MSHEFAVVSHKLLLRNILHVCRNILTQYLILTNTFLVDVGVSPLLLGIVVAFRPKFSPFFCLLELQSSFWAVVVAAWFIPVFWDAAAYMFSLARRRWQLYIIRKFIVCFFASCLPACLPWQTKKRLQIWPAEIPIRPRHNQKLWPYKKSLHMNSYLTAMGTYEFVYRFSSLWTSFFSLFFFFFGYSTNSLQKSLPKRKTNQPRIMRVRKLDSNTICHKCIVGQRQNILAQWEISRMDSDCKTPQSHFH